MTLKEDLVFLDLGYKHAFTGNGFMIEFNSILIKKGYCWDGASGGASDGKRIGGLPVTWKATCIHDILYQRKNPLSRKRIDELFYREMKTAGFKRAYIYYICVRLFGWMFYNGQMKQNRN